MSVWKIGVAYAIGAAAGVAVMLGIYSTQPGKIVVSDTIGTENEVYSVDSTYKYDRLRYKQEDGKLILELEYTKRGERNDE